MPACVTFSASSDLARGSITLLQGFETTQKSLAHVAPPLRREQLDTIYFGAEELFQISAVREKLFS